MPRQLKDATQVRGVVQSLVIWAQNNKDHYPLPSDLDKADWTIKSPAASKDTTGNILSLLIFNGSISPELLISPAEVNGSIQRDQNYQYTKPELAANPDKALWDPGFRGTPADRKLPGRSATAGNCSYAHAIPVGQRRDTQWTDSYSNTQAVFGNRGPTYVLSDFAPGQANWKLLDGPLGTGSNTLRIHGGRDTWEGNIGYNDGHVNFETKPNPENLTYILNTKAPATQSDNLFVNESDEAGGDTQPGRFTKSLNIYLRLISRMSEAGVPTVWRD